MFDYTWYAYVVIHQWALVNGWSGANSLSLRGWLTQPKEDRKDFRTMCMMGEEL